MLTAIVAAAVALASVSPAGAAGAPASSASTNAAAREIRSKAAVEQMMQADVNKDGTVTRDEVNRIDSQLGRGFGSADADRDGKLTVREFEKLQELKQGATGGAPPGGTARGGGPGTTRR
jgi:hypothetical protein